MFRWSGAREGARSLSLSSLLERRVEMLKGRVAVVMEDTGRREVEGRRIRWKSRGADIVYVFTLSIYLQSIEV